MIQLAECFQDQMVLQRQKPIRLWGTGDKRQQIQVYLNGEKKAAAQIHPGRFEILLPPQEAMEDAELKICGEAGSEFLIKQVDIGEVWIAGGQSNMEFLLRYDREGDDVIKAADDDHFRYYEVGKYAFEGEKEEGLKDASHWDRWMKYKTEDAPWFSAVGVYFAARLRAVLKVPVGIVGCSWGGTSASAWMTEKMLRQDPKLKVYTDAYDAAAGKLLPDRYQQWDRRVRERAASTCMVQNLEAMLKRESTKRPGAVVKVIGKILTKFRKNGPHDEHRPGGLYQTMLKKITGFSCRGVIWYQGESDEMYAGLYGRLFASMIKCWRRDWEEELPFLFVQLAPFEAWTGCNGKNFPLLRKQQQIVEDRVPGVCMASIMDVGSRYDIHPKEKRPVGERLALLAIGKLYGVEVECQAPRMEHMIREDKRLTVSFRYTGGHLVIRKDIEDGRYKHLFCVKQNGKVLAYTAEIKGNSVILQVPDSKSDEEIMVSFAYRPYCRMQLFGMCGLPARPFGPVIVK